MTDEFAVIKAVVNLDEGARDRVIRYLVDRFGSAPGGSGPKTYRSSRSIEQLIVDTLSRSAKAMTAGDIARQIGANKGSVATRMAQMRNDGLLVKRPFGYALPRTETEDDGGQA